MSTVEQLKNAEVWEAIPAAPSLCRKAPGATQVPPDDGKITFTGFIDQGAAAKCEHRVTLDELASMIATPIAADKSRLPWLELGRFGDQRSGKGCLRYKGNLWAITGIECDYDGKIDGGRTSFEDAIERLRQAGIEAITYTSPSHSTPPRRHGGGCCVRSPRNTRPVNAIAFLIV